MLAKIMYLQVLTYPQRPYYSVPRETHSSKGYVDRKLL